MYPCKPLEAHLNCLTEAIRVVFCEQGVDAFGDEHLADATLLRIRLDEVTGRANNL